jgi:hypothetical protein
LAPEPSAASTRLCASSHGRYWQSAKDHVRKRPARSTCTQTYVSVEVSLARGLGIYTAHGAGSATSSAMYGSLHDATKRGGGGVLEQALELLPSARGRGGQDRLVQNRCMTGGRRSCMCSSYTATLVGGRGCRRQPGRASSKPAAICPQQRREPPGRASCDSRHCLGCVLAAARAWSVPLGGTRHFRHGFRGAIVQGARGTAIRRRDEVAARIARYICIERVHGPAG